MSETEQIFGVTEPKPTESETMSESPVLPIADPDSVKRGEENTTPMAELANMVMSRFRENSDFRRTSGVEERLDYCLRAQTCEFSKSQIDKLSRHFNEELAHSIFAPITSTKNRAAKSMLVDLANQSGEPLFRIEPTPSPNVPEYVAERVEMKILSDIQNLFVGFAKQGVQELPPNVMANIQRLIVSASEMKYDEVSNAEDAYAKSRAKRMERKVWDSMVEGGFNEAFMQTIENVCTYGTGVMLGPVPKVVGVNKCVSSKNRKVGERGIVKYRRANEVRLCYEAVNPQDCYPAPDAKKVSDGAFCIRVKFANDELFRFTEQAKGSSGSRNWIVPVIDDILSRHPNGGVKINIVTYDPERRYCERNGVEDVNDCTFEGVRCFMSVRGSVLVQMGITKTQYGEKIELRRFYKTETIVVDNRVIYCRICRDEMEIPVSKCVFYSLPGSWWGESIADKCRMAQSVLNNCVKSLLDNMSTSASPIWWIQDVQRLYDKSIASGRMRSGMTVSFGPSMQGSAGAPIGSVSVPSTASELLGVWKVMQTQADLDSGLPAYTEGQSAGQSGALRTASGLAVFTEAANRGMKMVMTTIDRDVISNVARMTADYILLNDDDMELKGDVTIRPVGLIGKIMKAQRDNQRIQLFDMVQKSPILSQIAGIKGLVAMFRPSLQDLDINPDDVLPSKERMEEMELVAKIQQVFQATSAANGVKQNSADAQEGPDDGQPKEPAPGSVAERRNVA